MTQHNNERETKIKKMVEAMRTAGEREFNIIWWVVIGLLGLDE